MTDYPAEIDFEGLVIARLKADAAVTALVAATDVGTRLPRGWVASRPAVRIRRVGGLPTETEVQHLQRGAIQIEGYAPSTPEAFALTAAADVSVRKLAEPANRPAGWESVIVTKVGKQAPLYDAGDPDSDAERYVLTAVLYAHHAPG